MSSPRGRPSIAGSWFSEVLTRQDRLLPSGERHRRIGSMIALAVSSVLHAAAIATLLLRPGRALPPPVPPLEIEMVQQTAQIRGTPPPPASPPAPQAPPAPATAPSPPAIPLPPAPQAPQAVASAPSTPTPPSRRPPTPQAPSPEINLGNSAQDLDALSVTGDNVVPPAPDARYRNMPPHYPAGAARIGAEGTVQIVARIAPNGQALSVGVLNSSGNLDLDQEARRAVSLWHFSPAREGGRAVPYDYVVNIHFALGDR